MRAYLPAMILATVTMSACLSGAEEKPVIVALVGDSTVTAEAGWGKAFAGRFTDRVKVLNFAAGGRSSKSYLDEHRLPKVLEAKPDYMLIQFGHNDQPNKGPQRATDPATTYRDYLKIYVTKAREIGAKPILVSSVTRRYFDDKGLITSTLTPWAEAAKAVAAEMNVPFIDLHTASIAYHNRIGREASMAFNYKEGDLTHFNEKGAAAMADLVVQGLKQAEPTLAAYVKTGAP